MNVDFTRPVGVDQGILLNTNKQALIAYKKTKKRLSSVTVLEDRITDLEKKYDKLLELLGNTNG